MYVVVGFVAMLAYVFISNYIPYKMKIWHRIYFGELRKSAKLNTTKFSFYCPMYVKYNSIRQYKIHQSLKND